jgi:hypothetical protein
VPASTTGWGADVVSTAAGDFIKSLGPRSAAAQLFDMGTRINFDGVGAATIPKRVGGPDTNLSWVAEGAPIPFKQYFVDGVTFTVHTMAVGARRYQCSERCKL